MRDAFIGGGLVLDGRAEPDPRRRPCLYVVPVTPSWSVPLLRARQRLTVRQLRPSHRFDAVVGAPQLEERRHPLGPLREDLIGVLRGDEHHAEHRRDLLVGEAFVEQVRHRIDEDAARLLPAEWVREMLGDELRRAGPAWLVNRADDGSSLTVDDLDLPLGNQPDETFVRAARTSEPVRLALGVAVLAARRDASTAARDVPRGVGPADRRSITHESSLRTRGGSSERSSIAHGR